MAAKAADGERRKKGSGIRRLAVLCSGGDGPGMNCAIRSVVRTAIHEGVEAYGVSRGFQGLLSGSVEPMDAGSVGNIMQRGGTVLQTSRCDEFREEGTRREAFNILRRKKVDALVVIGGNGSFSGAWLLHKEHGIPVAGVPGTIDNDIEGTEYTIGFDTAVQTAVEAVDKIRDTAHSHDRTFVIEVMGRTSPEIAVRVGVCTGAESIVLPWEGMDLAAVAETVRRGRERGKGSSIIVVAEGKEPGAGYRLQKGLGEGHGLATHVCVLGHIQRGGNPTSRDRFIASEMGHRAVRALLGGEEGGAVAVVFDHGRVQATALSGCVAAKRDAPAWHLGLARTLSI